MSDSMPHQHNNKTKTVRIAAVSGAIDQSFNYQDNSRDSAAQKTREQDSQQIEDIMQRGLNIAEVSIGLGVNFVSRMSSILKDQVIDKIKSAQILTPEMSSPPPASQYYNHQENEQQASPETTQASNSDETLYLINRLSLFPADSVSISFSINNESLSAEKKIQISIEDFVGTTQKFSIAAENFTVTPLEKIIAPMDFDKFVFNGTIPEKAQEDTYNGGIIVREEQEYRIPIVLVVSRRQYQQTQENNANRKSENAE